MEHVSGSDWKAARLLAGHSLKEFSRVTGLSHDTLERLERGLQVRVSARDAVVNVLAARGVSIAGGYVQHRDGRVAPTIKAVGRFHGVRIRRARWRLRMPIEGLASRAAVSPATIRKLERSTDLNSDPLIAFYRLIGVLQLEGIVFAAKMHRGRGGDSSLVPRPLKEPLEISECRALKRSIRSQMALIDGAYDLRNPRLTKRGAVSQQGRGPREGRVSLKQLEAEMAQAVEEDPGPVSWTVAPYVSSDLPASSDASDPRGDHAAAAGAL